MVQSSDEEYRPDPLHDEEWHKPYADRDKVTLAVGEHETIGQVLARSVEEFRSKYPEGDFDYAGTFCAFYKPADEYGFSGTLETSVMLVGRDGKAILEYFADVPYGRLLEASDAGALDGDPLRPYLILKPPEGNGMPFDWDIALQLWQQTFEILDDLAVLGGALATKISESAEPCG